MRFRFLASAILGTVLWAEFGLQSVAALSCIAPDLARTMEDAKASDKLYHIIVGEFTLVSKQELPRKNNVPGWSGPDFPNPVRAEMRFDGYSLASSAYADQPLSDFRLDAETSCAAHWCGGLPAEDKTFIAFIEARPGHKGQKPILTLGPCPQYLFWAQPGGQQVETLRKLF